MDKRNHENPLTLTILALTAGGSILFARVALPYFAPQWWSSFPARWKLASGAIPFMILLLSGLWSLRRHRDNWPDEEITRDDLLQKEQELQKTQGRLQALFDLNRLSVTSKEEGEIIEGALKLAVDITEADGASFVPLDQHAYPLESTTYGAQPTTDLKAWVEYLASPTVHSRCQACQKKEPIQNCPLLQDPFDQDLKLYCFPLRLGEHEFGVINVYLKDSEPLDGSTQQFVQMVADHLTLALESVHFKHREQDLFSQLRDWDAEPNLQQALRDELRRVQSLFDTDFASLTMQTYPEKTMASQLDTGTLPEHIRGEVEGLVQKVLQTGEPLLLGNGNNGNGSESPRHSSMMAAPLTSQGEDIAGVLVVGKRGRHPFGPQQLTALQNMVHQFTLLIHNINLMHELKYQTMLQERTRLAREIHDGLAQTLGYLKLQIAQIKSGLERDEVAVLPEIVRQSHQVVSEAYNDAREAIDGLQVDPTEKSFTTWLKQTVSIFKQNSGIENTILEVDDEFDLPPEVQIQLIRIIQEALSNVRKHAQANKVEVTSREEENGITIQIRDDGRGFSTDQIESQLQHGIKGMRERARLIQARFRITSQPRRGTTVDIHWHPHSMERSYE